MIVVSNDGVFLDLRPSVKYCPSDLLARVLQLLDELVDAAPGPPASPSRSAWP